MSNDQFNDSSANVIEFNRHSIYTNIMRLVDMIMEDDQYNQVLSDSMDTYNAELFRKSETDVPITLPEVVLEETPAEPCRICLESLNKGESVYKLPCIHVFHKECIKSAVNHQHALCPLCRQDIFQ
jgi:hypothetical protein